jgi:hypothetical protein
MSLRTPSDIPGWTAGRHQGARAHLLGVFAFRSFPVSRELAPPTKAGKTWIAEVLRNLPMNSFCRSEVMSHLPPHPAPSSGGRSSRDAAQGVFAFRSFPVSRELAPPTKAGKTWIAEVLRSLLKKSFWKSAVMSHLFPHPAPSSGGRSSRDAARGVFAFRSFPVSRELAPPTKAGKPWIAAILEKAS